MMGPSPLRTVVGALVVIGVVAATTPAHASTEGMVDRQAVDRFVTQRLAANGVPGMALALTHRDRVLYVHGYGRAGDGKPVTGRTQFRIASLSKSFTALAVMQLAQAGRVDLDASVVRYLPQFAPDDPRADQITVRHLLNQTSGMSDLGFPAARLPQPDSLAARLRSLRAADLASPPGAEFHYFNPNYSVLARLVEVVTGEAFPAYLRRHVFTPLRMTSTFTAATAQTATRRATRLAQGHVLLFGQPIAQPEQDGFLGGYGGVVSTAQDMAHWLIAQNRAGAYDGWRVLSPEGISLMHTPPAGVNGDYAMGWAVTRQPHGPRLEHNGVLSTFYAEQVLVPGSDYGLAVMFNSYNALVDYHGITAGVVSLLVDGAEPGGGIGANLIGIALAVLTAATLALRVRALVQLPRWSRRHRGRSVWRALPAMAWLLLPAAVLAGMPHLFAALSGRAFTYHQLFLAMPSISIWLGVAAVTGLVIVAARVLLRIRGSGPTSLTCPVPRIDDEGHVSAPRGRGSGLRP